MLVRFSNCRFYLFVYDCLSAPSDLAKIVKIIEARSPHALVRSPKQYQETCHFLKTILSQISNSNTDKQLNIDALNSQCFYEVSRKEGRKEGRIEGR